MVNSLIQKYPLITLAFPLQDVRNTEEMEKTTYGLRSVRGRLSSEAEIE